MTAAGVITGRGQEAGHEPRRVLHRGAPSRRRGLLPASGLACSGRRPPRSGQGAGAGNRYAARCVIRERAGIVWVCRPAGGVSRTATQVPAAAGADDGVFPGPAGQVSRRLGGRPGQPAGVSHATVAQVRTDLQEISPVERNWSDRGWRLAVAGGVPGRLGTWQVSHPPAPEPGLDNGPVRPRVRARALWRRLYERRPARTC